MLGVAVEIQRSLARCDRIFPSGDSRSFVHSQAKREDSLIGRAQRRYRRYHRGTRSRTGLKEWAQSFERRDRAEEIQRKHGLFWTATGICNDPVNPASGETRDAVD